MKRAITCLFAGLMALLLILAIAFFLKKGTTVPPNEPINDAFWLNLDRRRSDIYREELKKAPQILVVRKSHYSFNPTNGIGMHYGWIDGRLADLHISFSELVGHAYSKDGSSDEAQYARTEFPDEWTRGQLTNTFDLIVTVTNSPREAMQAEARKFLKDQYGLAWHWQVKDTQELLILAKDPRLLESKTSTDFAQSTSMADLAGDLENYFGLTVVDETGATKRYDKTLELVPARWVNGRTTDLAANNNFLAQYGLELVLTNQPQDWLVMEKVN